MVKAGATPNLVVENRIEYIKNFNWLKIGSIYIFLIRFLILF